MFGEDDDISESIYPAKEQRRDGIIVITIMVGWFLFLVSLIFIT